MNETLRSAVLLLCDVDTAVPLRSHREFATGVMVMVSLPSATPLVANFKLNSGPNPPEIAVGVVLERVAVPPEMDNEKSDASGCPLPPLVL